MITDQYTYTGEGPFRVALVSLWIGAMPEWIEYTIKSMSYASHRGLVD